MIPDSVQTDWSFDCQRFVRPGRLGIDRSFDETVARRVIRELYPEGAPVVVVTWTDPSDRYFSIRTVFHADEKGQPTGEELSLELVKRGVAYPGGSRGRQQWASAVPVRGESTEQWKNRVRVKDPSTRGGERRNQLVDAFADAWDHNVGETAKCNKD